MILAHKSLFSNDADHYKDSLTIPDTAILEISSGSINYF